MSKILQFIIKNNMKITLLSFFLPLLFQLKSIVAPPIIALYDKVPSLSQAYDNILSLRNPFATKKHSIYYDTILNITETYENDKSISRDTLVNIKFIAKELLNIREKTTDPKQKENINKIIKDFQHKKFNSVKNLFTQKFTISTTAKQQAKYLGFNAILTELRNKDKAIILYKQALEIDNENLFILNNLGNLYITNQLYIEATKIFKKIMEVAKKSNNKPAVLSLAYSNLGVINLEQENFSNAMKFFKKALNVNKKHQLDLSMATQYSNIGLTYETLKDKENACINYRRARIIFYRHYQDQEADKILQKLKQLDCL